MIKEAIEYIVGLNEPHIVDEHALGQFSDKEFNRIAYNPKASTLELTTLSSLVDYLKSEIDSFEAVGSGSISPESSTVCASMLIHIVSPTEVELLSPLDMERKRERVVVVNAAVPRFDFNKFMSQEEFIIGVQSKFQTDTGVVCDDVTLNDKALLLKFAGTVEAGSIAEYGDDGITQKAAVKTGIASKSEAVVPNPVCLYPYRTFIEVPQPPSKFIFRMKQDKYDGVSCALYEADGGAWKNIAMQNIKEYLMEELKEFPEFRVIS